MILGRFQSFILGMAIAAGVLGAGSLLLDALDGVGAPPTEAQATAQDTPSISLIAPTAPALPAPVDLTPRTEPAPASVTVEPTATPEPDVEAAIAAEPPAPEPAAPVPPQPEPVRSLQQPRPPAPQAPAPASPPALPPAPTPEPLLQTLSGITAGLMADTNALAARVASPAGFSDGWNEATIALAKKVEHAGGVVSIMSPPACLRQAYALLRAASSDLSFASGVIASAIEQRDVKQLAFGADRLASGRTGLPGVQAALAAAAC